MPPHAYPPFRIKRVALLANVLTPMYPPGTAKSLSIGNAGSADLEVHTAEDETEYLVIAAGYERTVPVNMHILTTDRVICWLKTSVAGTAVLLWY